MKAILSALLALLMLACTPAAWAVSEKSVTVMSYNIRCGSCEDPSDVNHWSKRKFLVAKVIRAAKADVVGLQEAELFQVADLVALLKDFDWVGVGREDGREQGEMNAVLVRKKRFSIAAQQTLWLSPTPDKVSRGWDAALNRTVALLTLKSKESGRSWYFLNTHFDHQGPVARTQSAKQIAALVQPLLTLAPVVVVGDLNGTARFDGYTTLTATLQDAARISATPALGGDITFNGFGKDLQPGNTIDYVLVSPGIKVQSHRVISDRYQGLYPSDHFPIATRLSF
jgi:endonuclease/exonuclease/phosphatase family metal-dependent hydrolase